MAAVATAALLATGGAVAWADWTQPGGTFLDDDGRNEEGYIEAIAARGVTTGCGGGNFCIDAPVSRQDMAIFILRARELMLGPSPVPSTNFNDIAGLYGEQAIRIVATAGITAGCGDGNYCPFASVTRGEMAIFLARLLSLSPRPSTFTDTGGHFAEQWIGAIHNRGITAGCTGSSYCPDQPVTRGEMAIFLARTLGLQPLYPPPRGTTTTSVAGTTTTFTASTTTTTGPPPTGAIITFSGAGDTPVFSATSPWRIEFSGTDCLIGLFDSGGSIADSEFASGGIMQQRDSGSFYIDGDTDCSGTAYVGSGATSLPITNYGTDTYPFYVATVWSIDVTGTECLVGVFADATGSIVDSEFGDNYTMYEPTPGQYWVEGDTDCTTTIHA